MKNDDISDDDFDAFLNGKDALSRRLHALPQPLSPAALDAAILARVQGMLKQEQGQEQRPQAANDAGEENPAPRLQPNFATRWRLPVGIAATLLAGVFAQQAFKASGEREEAALMPIASEQMTPAAAPAAPPPPVMADVPLARPAQPRAEVPVRESALPSLEKHVAQKAAPPKMRAPGAEPPPVPAAVVQERGQDRVQDTVQERKQESAQERAQERAQAKVREKPGAVTLPPAPALPPPPSEVSGRYLADTETARPAGIAARAAAPAVAGAPAPAPAHAAAAPVAPSPVAQARAQATNITITGSRVMRADAPEPAEEWLGVIDALLKANLNADVRAEWDRFRRAYPDYPVPAELKARIDAIH